jgi:hypothetical protein
MRALVKKGAIPPVRGNDPRASKEAEHLLFLCLLKIASPCMLLRMIWA